MLCQFIIINIIKKTEPRKFWSAVRPKRKPKCAVDNETISKYFENVLGADPPELSEEVLNLINNDHFENVDVDALDSEILVYLHLRTKIINVRLVY
jgi:hypothetical protein